MHSLANNQFSENCTLGLSPLNADRIHNPTLEENIQAKIDWHLTEVDRLQKLKETLGDSLMKVNLRDLREAMNF